MPRANKEKQYPLMLQAIHHCRKREIYTPEGTNLFLSGKHLYFTKRLHENFAHTFHLSHVCIDLINSRMW